VTAGIGSGAVEQGADKSPKGLASLPATALRLTFSYKGDRVTLESREELDMTPLPSDTDVPDGRERGPVAQLGARLELVDPEGRVLYERVTRHLIPESIEGPTDEPERPLTRRAIAQTAGVFDVVVPLLQGAHELVLYRGPSEELIQRGEAEPLFREVLRVPLISPN
jgi:hypothetical protein